MKQRIFVFAHLHTGAPVIAGVLEYDEAGRSGLFRYARSYLDRPDAIPLAMREEFALTPARVLETANEGIPGPIRDALPDYWGRLVFASRREMPVEKVRNADMLLARVAERAGFLDFSEQPEWPGNPRAAMDIPLIDDVHLLVQTADALADHRPISAEGEFLLKLLAQGTSMGGARPKSVIRIGEALWLAKFPSIRDHFDVSAVEYATHAMARDAGITVPETRLLQLPDGRHVFLSRRFDRIGHVRVPMVSALTALHLDEFENARGSYPAIGDVLRQQGDEHGVRELFGRMVFNVLIRNTDDHLRNHALLYDRASKAWKLSPAYDLNPGISRMGVGMEFGLSINIGAFGRAATLQNIQSSAAAFGVEPAESTRAISSMLDTIANWRKYFQDADVDSRTSEVFADTFASSLKSFERLGVDPLSAKDRNQAGGTLSSKRQR